MSFTVVIFALMANSSEGRTLTLFCHVLCLSISYWLGRSQWVRGK